MKPIARKIAIIITLLIASSHLSRAAQPDTSVLAAIDFTNVDMLSQWLETIEEGDERESLVADILQEAHRFQGVNYRRGAKGPKSFDCSGFTSYVFKQFGMSLSPSSRGQYTQGTSVDDNDIMPGDLVFFKGRKAANVGHVGIAIEQNPVTGVVTFIHAAVKGGIRIDDTSAPYYKNRFVGARRVL